jgi:hypothetical protein
MEYDSHTIHRLGFRQVVLSIHHIILSFHPRVSSLDLDDQIFQIDRYIEQADLDSPIPSPTFELEDDNGLYNYDDNYF